MSYLIERFEAAVFALVGEGSTKDRLVAAYAEHLDDLENSELPQSLQTTFEELRMALHAVMPLGKEPCVCATIRKMSMLQAGNHGRTIVSLYAELVRGGERAEPLRAVNGKEAARLVSQRD